MNKIVFEGVGFIEPDFINAYEYEQLTRNAIKDGTLIKKRCEICNNPKSVAHHEIYSDYMNVRWLCPKHHNLIHRVFRLMRFNSKILGMPKKSTRIDISKLIEESGQKITIHDLAKEMKKAGLYKNIKSANSILLMTDHGMVKSIKYDLLAYLSKRFNVEFNQIINWND